MTRTMTARDAAARQTAEALWARLDDYNRSEIHRWGTAFTDLEDHGEDVCAWIRHIARRWATARDADAHAAKIRAGQR